MPGRAIVPTVVGVGDGVRGLCITPPRGKHVRAAAAGDGTFGDDGTFGSMGRMSVQPLSPIQAERFKRLAWPLMPVVLRTARCLVRQAEQAEDLAQETMLKALRAMDRFADGTDPKAWLLTILRRTHIDRVRSEVRAPGELSLDAVQSVVESPSEPPAGRFDGAWTDPESLMARFEDDAVIDALRSLPEDIRWTLLLVDVEQLDQSEAATALGVAVGTIKSRTHRGRAMLRDLLHATAIARGWIQPRE